LLNILNFRASGWVLPLAIFVLTLLLLTFAVQSWFVSRSVFNNEIAHINRVALQNARSVMIARRESFNLLGQELLALDALQQPDAGRDTLEKVAFLCPVSSVLVWPAVMVKWFCTQRRANLTPIL